MPTLKTRDEPRDPAGVGAELGLEQRRVERGERVVGAEAEAHRRRGPRELAEEGRVEDRARDARGARLHRLLPLVALGDAEADGNDEQGRQGGAHEERAPAPVRQHDGGDGRRKQVPDGPAALQHARGDAAAARRPVLHRERGARGPLGAHAEPEERAQHEDPAERRRQRDGAVAEREPEDGDHQGQLAPPAVRGGAGDEAAGEAREERQRDRSGRGDARDAELARDVRHHEHEDGEVERVEDPPGPRGAEGAPLRARRLPPPRDGLHAHPPGSAYSNGRSIPEELYFPRIVPARVTRDAGTHRLEARRG